jgi:hypothetical protein
MVIATVTAMTTTTRGGILRYDLFFLSTRGLTQRHQTHSSSLQDHPVDHGDHVHESRAIVEATALEREGEPRPAQRLAETLLKTLINKVSTYSRNVAFMGAAV